MDLLENHPTKFEVIRASRFRVMASDTPVRLMTPLQLELGHNLESGRNNGGIPLSTASKF